ncbi:hypothetical protein, partial [Streptomyces virginiae]
MPGGIVTRILTVQHDHDEENEGLPHMQNSPDLGRSSLDKKDPWAKFRGLAWWQLVLSIAPILLLPVGGAIGGAIGAAGMFVNLSLASCRSPVSGL